MAICASILKHQFNNFHLYVLELCQPLISKHDFMLREDFWYQLIKPSYNLQKIIQPFKGENHYRFGKTVSQETKDKISQSLKNRIVSEEERINHSLGAKKRKVHRRGPRTIELVVIFDGIRGMVRELQLSNNSLIYARLDKNKPLTCNYLGVERSWLLFSTPL